MAAKMPTKEELIALRNKHSNIEIAKLKKVSTSTIKRWVKKLDIAPREVHKDVEPEKSKGMPMPLDDGLSLMEKCARILGKRMSEDNRGYMLDGRPCSSRKLIELAGLELRQ